MKTTDFKTKGTCSRNIHVEIDDDNIIRNIIFDGGCNGNTKGVAKLAIGRPAKEVADLLRNTMCGTRGTSCPDQLSKAIDAMLLEA